MRNCSSTRAERPDDSFGPNEAGNASVLLPAPAGFSAADKQSHLVQLGVDSVTSPHSKRAYRTGLEQFFGWWAATAAAESFGRPLVQRYRSFLEEQGKAPATINRACLLALNTAYIANLSLCLLVYSEATGSVRSRSGWFVMMVLVWPMIFELVWIIIQAFKTPPLFRNVTV